MLLNLPNSGLRGRVRGRDADIRPRADALGTVAARALLGRKLARSRWSGVAIVAAVGVAIMDERASHGRRVRTDKDADSGSGGNAGGKDHNAGGARWPRGGSHASDATIGFALILLQLTLSVLHQDVVEEICMQSADFPATEMLGMEGAYGSVLSFVAVFVGRGGGDRLRLIEDISSTLMMLRENPNARRCAAYLPLLFLVTNIFNIMATDATSARWHIPVFVPFFLVPESRAGFLFRPDSGGIWP